MIKSSRIAVIYGGESNERDVSIRSGKNVMGALKRQGYTNLFHWDPKEHELKDLQADAAFIALHGKHGEDGTIQGALELKRIPYTGTGVLGSAIGMNKWLCKQLMTACGLPTAPYQLLTDTVTIQWPVVAKPIAGGSSIGVHFCANDDELEAVKKTLKNPETYFIE
ncbi:D-alanine--D-alanine ligase, partial [bacterium]|nr:D-alanine--D-alanine ligase [bacterium]